MKCQICNQEYQNSVITGICNQCYRKQTSKKQKLSFFTWVKRYKPILDGYNMLQLYYPKGRDLVEIYKLNPVNIWSVCNKKNKQVIHNGILLNNAIYYVVTKKPHDSKNQITVLLEEKWQTRRLNGL